MGPFGLNFCPKGLDIWEHTAVIYFTGYKRPKVFNWVKVRAVGGPGQDRDPPVTEEPLNNIGPVDRSIILLLTGNQTYS